jgi:glycosyltransferase involved in cell wall biosynthesis
VVPFTDDEERIGALLGKVAAHLRALGLRFEILAVDEDCRDNTLPLVQFLMTKLPELRILLAEHGLGFATGAAFARGQVVWLLDADAKAPCLPFRRAHERLAGGVTDIVAIRGRFLACRRSRVWKLLGEVRGRGETYQRRILRKAAARRLHVTQWAGGEPPPMRRFWQALLGPFARMKLATK